MDGVLGGDSVNLGPAHPSIQSVGGWGERRHTTGARHDKFLGGVRGRSNGRDGALVSLKGGAKHNLDVGGGRVHGSGRSHSYFEGARPGVGGGIILSDGTWAAVQV